jgi:inner membrane protein
LDPIAHTLTGATLAVSGLRRATPLATATLLIGVNAPDVDALTFFAGSFQSLASRRGITHGVLALAIWPFVVTAFVLAWDRLARLRSTPGAPPARAERILGLAALAVLTHPILDWLNNYGMRWLMPFDGTWFYGDAIFVIDPWFWLALGGIPFLLYSRRRASLIAWCMFWLIASLLVLTTADIPRAARVLWLAVVAALFAARAFGPAPIGHERRFESGARALLALIAAYAGAMSVIDLAERAMVRTELANRGIGPVESVMVAPVPANPFAGDVVAATPTAYYVGRWQWLAEPKLTLAAGEPLVRNVDEPIYKAAAATIEAERFLTWARFPFALVETKRGEHTVQFLDARYHAAGRLSGPTVRLDAELAPLP